MAQIVRPTDGGSPAFGRTIRLSSNEPDAARRSARHALLDLGERIARTREALSRTKAEIAGEAMIDTDTYEAIEDGLLEPGYVVLLRIAEALGTSIRELSPTTRPSATLPALTSRETETLRLVVMGLTNPEIAAEMVVSPRTVQSHIASVMRKLNARSRTHLAVQALRLGLVPLDLP